MEKLEQLIQNQFGDELALIKLFDVVYDRAAADCTVCFLLPYTAPDIKSSQRTQLQKLVTEQLGLTCPVRVKFRKSFLDEPLINKEVKNFFDQEAKALVPFISEKNITSQHQELDVKITISLNEDVLSLVDEQSLKQKLLAFLSKRFIANFSIDVVQNEDRLPDEIEVDDILPAANSSPRYEVQILRKGFGGSIIPKPEYIKNITSPKTSVILAGRASGFAKKSFVIKKGKKQGEEKSYYSFVLKDETGSIECVYFCPKSNEKIMDSISENASSLMLVFVGNIAKGLTDKLTYYIRKLSICSPVEKKQTLAQPQAQTTTRKPVVIPQPIQTLTQDTLFEQQKVYNDTITSNTIVVFDIETTGLNPDVCEITEIGAVKIVGGRIVERFASFVKTQHPIPEEVTRLTHITNEMIADAPSLQDVILDFYNYTRGCIISGYNVIDFDMKFIKKAGQKFGLKFDNTILDAFIMARQSSLRVGNYKLGTVVKALGVTLVDAHRAYNDAEATAKVLLELSKIKK